MSSRHDNSLLLRYVDVGALGGVDKRLTSYQSRIWPILFEANPEQGESIRSGLACFPHSTLIPCGLGHLDGVSKLTVTRNPTCSSFLKPKHSFLKNYGISYHFKEEKEVDVTLCRYDTLHKSGQVPTPDAIKIDVQGFEYQVLLGFGNTLHDCLAIRLESHFYSIYENEKSFSDVISLLAEFGFVLRKIDSDKMGNFAGDLVEFDAYFTKTRQNIKASNVKVKDKYDIITALWDLPEYDLTIS